MLGLGFGLGLGLTLSLTLTLTLTRNLFTTNICEVFFAIFTYMAGYWTQKNHMDKRGWKAEEEIKGNSVV